MPVQKDIDWEIIRAIFESLRIIKECTIADLARKTKFPRKIIEDYVLIFTDLGRSDYGHANTVTILN